MSRSYHSTRNELRKMEREKYSYSPDYFHYKQIKGLKGELERKRYVKKREIELRKVRKLLPQLNIDWDDLSRARNKEQISEIKILKDDEKDAVFPVSEEDVNWILSCFSALDLLNVKAIHFQNIRLEEIMPGVRIPIILGRYYYDDDKIIISGLVIYKTDYSFLKHILFYYKVILISVLSHEIIHNLDYNSIGIRKGYAYLKKHLSIEGLADTLQAEFYQNNIIPYVKEEYKDEYKEFQEWMSTLGVLPLGIEYWTPSMVTMYSYDGMLSIFSGIKEGKSPAELNLELAQELWFGEHFHQSLLYLDHLLSEIDVENYDALKLKAQILCNDLGQFEKADAAYSKFFTSDLKDVSVIGNYAYAKMKLHKYDDAYHLLLKIPLLESWNLLVYAHCLNKLKKKVELNRLIAQLKTGVYNSKMSLNQHKLYLMFIYASQKNYSESIMYYISLNTKELEWMELHWARYIAAKIYIVLHDYKNAKIALRYHKDSDEHHFGIKLVRKIKNLNEKIKNKR